MADRDALADARTADNSLADSLPGEAFGWGEDTDPTDAGDTTAEGSEEQPSDEDILSAQTEQTQDGEEEPVEQAAPGKAPAAAKPQAQAPAGSPAATQSPVQPSAPASGQEQPRPVPTFHEMVRANWPKAVDHVVAGGAFRLSPEEAEIIDPAAAPVIERMAAKIYLQVMAAQSEMLHTTLPRVVHSMVGVTNEGSASEQAFYQQYGFNASHKQQLEQIGQFMLANRPELRGNGKLFAEELAKFGYSYLGVQKPQGKPKGNGAQAQPRTVAKRAFTPAGQTAGGQPQKRFAPGQQKPKPAMLDDLNAMLSSVVDMDD